eukprot:scaffold14513_cov276-Alexandrium_tamarense.AAC.3
MHRRVITSAITSTLLQPIAAIIRLTILLITLINDGDLTKGAARSLWRQRPVGGGEADFGFCLLVGQLVYVSMPTGNGTAGGREMVDGTMACDVLDSLQLGMGDIHDGHILDDDGYELSR